MHFVLRDTSEIYKHEKKKLKKNQQKFHQQQQQHQERLPFNVFFFFRYNENLEIYKKNVHVNKRFCLFSVFVLHKASGYLSLCKKIFSTQINLNLTHITASL